MVKNESILTDSIYLLSQQYRQFMLKIAVKWEKSKIIFTLSRNGPALVSFWHETAIFLYCFLLLVSFVHGTVSITKRNIIPQQSEDKCG